MLKATLIAVIVGLFSTASLAGPITLYTDYQGPGGDLCVSSNWYVISDPSDPASRTGETRLPGSDSQAFVRNATTTTLAQALTAGVFHVGGPGIAGAGAAPAATLHVVDGADLGVWISSALEGLHVGESGRGTIVQTGGTVKVTGFILSPNCTYIGDLGGRGELDLQGGSFLVYNVQLGSNMPAVGVVRQGGGLFSFAHMDIVNGHFRALGGTLLGCATFRTLQVGASTYGGSQTLALSS
jgi:hypothetical protein